MTTLTVRNLDDATREGLKALAAEHGRSMEAEARKILRDAVLGERGSDERGLGTRIHTLFADMDWPAFERVDDEARAVDLR